MKLLAFLFFFVLFTEIAAAEQTVSPSGSNSDQNIINQALSQVAQAGGGTVYLNAGVYEITGPINIGSNTVLTGDSKAIIRVSSSSSQWFVGTTGIINPQEFPLKNVEIYGFQIDGNLDQLPRSYANYKGDHDAERLIYLRGSKKAFMEDISVHDMQLYDSYSDGIQIAYANNVQCYNNFVSNCQHSGIFLISVVYGAIHGNDVAGITSDCVRLDNCVNCTIYNNVLYSYTGDNTNGQGTNGENGLQVADEGFSHGGGSEKPTHTTNIEVYNNTFANTGWHGIWLDSTGKGVDNVYIHDNIFLKGEELETKGISVEGISFDNPPSKELSEKIFSSIFDILNMSFYDSAITNQSDDSIQYTVQKTTIGKIAGGVKIIGFRNQVVIDNRTYMQDNNSTIVKSEAILAQPSLDFWNKGVDKIDKDIDVEVKNGTATATMTVNMRMYSVSYNQATRRTTKTYRSYTANFNDTANAPEIFPAPQNIKGEIEVYPTFFEVYVPADGLVKLDFTYGVNVSTHSFLVGEREQKNNVEYTEYTRLEDWSGDLNHTGQWCFVYGTFDESKLHVKATTPYQEVNVTDFNITWHDYPKEPIAFWFYPTVWFLICLYFIGKFFWRRIWY